jgi:predicted DNA-binding protein (UPF0278 family)
MNKTCLSDSIEKLREELNKAIEQGCLNSDDVLKISHKLDALILEYLRNKDQA